MPPQVASPRAQLDEINALRRHAYRRASSRNDMELASDPEYLKVKQKLMPEIFSQEMPAIIASAQKATADSLPPRGYRDLTAAEKKKLQALIGG